MTNSTKVKLKEIVNDTELSAEEVLARVFKLGVVHGIEVALDRSHELIDIIKDKSET
jgi:hypothetical protein